MIIPVKCVTCGRVIADKYRYYLREVQKKKLGEQYDQNVKIEKFTYLTTRNISKTTEGEVLDELGFTKMCCRRHLLTHVEIE